MSAKETNDHTDELNRLKKKQGTFLNVIFRGRILLINPEFQLKFIGLSIVILLLSLSIFFLANEVFFHNFITKGQALNLPANHPFYLLLQEQKSYMGKVFIVASILLGLSFSIVGLVFSHRIAGPLYRLTRYFQNAARSKDLYPTHLHFREKDFFQEIPQAVNEFLDCKNKSQDKITSIDDKNIHRDVGGLQ